MAGIRTTLHHFSPCELGMYVCIYGNKISLQSFENSFKHRIFHVFFHDDINDNNIDKPKFKKKEREGERRLYYCWLSFFLAVTFNLIILCRFTELMDHLTWTLQAKSRELHHFLFIKVLILTWTDMKIIFWGVLENLQ